MGKEKTTKPTKASTPRQPKAATLLGNLTHYLDSHSGLDTVASLVASLEQEIVAEATAKYRS